MDAVEEDRAKELLIATAEKMNYADRDSFYEMSWGSLFDVAVQALSLARSNGWQDGEVLTDDGLSGMWKVRAKRAEAALEKLENYCFGLETQVGGFRPEVIRELFARLPEPPLDRLRGSEDKSNV